MRPKSGAPGKWHTARHTNLIPSLARSLLQRQNGNSLGDLEERRILVGAAVDLDEVRRT